MTKNKYSREILPDVWVDVYDVLGAFKTGCSAMDHAAKKILAAGTRGYKPSIQDKEEAIQSIQRSIEREKMFADANRDDSAFDTAMFIAPKIMPKAHKIYPPVAVPVWSGVDPAKEGAEATVIRKPIGKERLDDHRTEPVPIGVPFSVDGVKYEHWCWDPATNKHLTRPCDMNGNPVTPDTPKEMIVDPDDDWFEWTGVGLPLLVPQGAEVEVELRNGVTLTRRCAGSLHWRWDADRPDKDILRYKVYTDTEEGKAE